MAYRNLDNAKYPDLHPTAPVRYVELQPSPPPLVAVPAQPVYYQPEGAAYAQVPYATPDAPYAQPTETAPPMALPVNQANAVSGMYIPPALTPEEFDVAIERQVRFRGCKYFRESKVFFKRNWCKLMTVTVMWVLVFMSLGCAIHRINPTHGGYGYHMNPHMPQDTSYTSPSTSVPSDPTSMPYDDDVPARPEIQTDYARQKIQCKVVLQMALMFLSAILIGMPAFAGMFVAVFNAMRTNGPIRYKDFFSCFCCRYYCRLIPLSVTLKVVTGLLSILIVPAIWFGFATIFAVPLHREHRFLGTCKSIRASIKVVHRYFCKILGFLILNGLLQLLGFFLFGIGLLVTIPLSFVALCYCYNDLIGVNGMPMLLDEPEVV
jgi:hypothetical protein